MEGEIFLLGGPVATSVPLVDVTSGTLVLRSPPCEVLCRAIGYSQVTRRYA